MIDQVPRRQLTLQAAAVVAGMVVWLAIIPRIPGLSDLPGLGVLAAFAVVALVFDYRAAFAGVTAKSTPNPNSTMTAPLSFAAGGADSICASTILMNFIQIA